MNNNITNYYWSTREGGFFQFFSLRQSSVGGQKVILQKDALYNDWNDEISPQMSQLINFYFELYEPYRWRCLLITSNSRMKSQQPQESCSSIIIRANHAKRGWYACRQTVNLQRPNETLKNPVSLVYRTISLDFKNSVHCLELLSWLVCSRDLSPVLAFLKPMTLKTLKNMHFFRFFTSIDESSLTWSQLISDLNDTACLTKSGHPIGERITICSHKQR